MDTIFDLQPQGGELLYAAKSGSPLEVRQQGTWRWIFTGGNAIQSLINIDNPSLPVLPVHQAMLAGFALREELPQRVLNLGFGGGVFERFISQKFAQLELSSVDLDARLPVLLKEWFFLDNIQQCLQSISAEEAINSSAPASQDYIFYDLYDGGNPANCLRDVNFISKLKNYLAKNGVLTVNLLPRNPQELLLDLQLLRQHFPHVAMIRFKKLDNTVLWLSEQTLPPKLELLDRLKPWGTFLQSSLQDLTFLPIAKNL